MPLVKFIKVEYDPEYTGGDYHKIGEMSLLPLDECEKKGVEVTFSRWMDLDPIHIVHYSLDEHYNALGELIEGDDA